MHSARHGQGLGEGHSIWIRQIGSIGQIQGLAPTCNDLMLFNVGLQQLPRGQHALPQVELLDPHTQVIPVVEAGAEVEGHLEEVRGGDDEGCIPLSI